MKQSIYESLSKKEKRETWKEAIKKVNKKNWEKYFDELNTLEVPERLNFSENDRLLLKLIFQHAIVTYFKPFTKYLIKSMKEKK